MNVSMLRKIGQRRLSAVQLRLLVLGLTAPLAVWLGFVAFSIPEATTVVAESGYYALLLAFAGFGVTLFCLWKNRAPSASPMQLREAVMAMAAITFFSSLAINSEAFGAKVLNDEFVLQSSAYNLHHFREASTMVRGYDVKGTFLSLGTYLDKRPFFYPFLVSIMHDLFGYRPLNAYLVNATLTPVLFSLVWWLARRLASPAAGLLAVALLGTLPLIGQNATGSGMEMTNVVMILAATVLAVLYIEKPDERHLTALVLALVLLCQSRYESAVYVGVGVLVIGLGWCRTRRITLSWPVVLAPLLLVPFALQQKVLNASPALWELSEEKSVRFSLSYIPGNLRQAFEFLFGNNRNLAGSWYLSWIGLAGVVWLGLRGFTLWRRRTGAATPTVWVVAFFSIGILANLALVMAYYWAGLDDPMASRFALPFCVLLAVLGAIALASLPGRPSWALVGGVGALVFTFGVTIPRYARHEYSNTGIREQDWAVRTVEMVAVSPRLVITNNTTLLWLLHKTPSVLIASARTRSVQDNIRFQMNEGWFQDFLVTQELRPASIEGQHEVVPEDMLPSNYHLQTIAEKRFGTKLVRISRVTALDPSL